MFGFCLLFSLFATRKKCIIRLADTAVDIPSLSTKSILKGSKQQEHPEIDHQISICFKCSLPRKIMSSEAQSKTNELCSEAPTRDSSDSTQEIEEFSSFDISDNEASVKSKSTRKSGANSSRKSFYESEEEHEELKSIRNEGHQEGIDDGPPENISANGTTTARSNTPELSEYKEHMFDSFDSDYKIKSPQLNNGTSRMSSDTFETPRTVDTRASTMTSGLNDFHNIETINQGLMLSGATVHEVPSKRILDISQKTPDKFPVARTAQKRLSRHSNTDTLFDMEVASQPIMSTNALSALFAKTTMESNALGNRNKAVPNLVPSSNEIIDLQNQLTSCKIQIKLQNDLLREKLSQRVGNKINKQELSEELEWQLQSSINSSKYKFQLDQMNAQYKALEVQFDEVLRENENFIGKIEHLQEQCKNNTDKQLEWQNKVRDIVKGLKIPNQLHSNIEVGGLDELLNLCDEYVQLTVNSNRSLSESESKKEEELITLKNRVSSLMNDLELKENEILGIQSQLEAKIHDLEDKNFSIKSDLFHSESSLKSELLRTQKLQGEYEKLERKLLEMDVINQRNKGANDSRIKLLQDQLHDLMKENGVLKSKLNTSSRKGERLIVSMVSYHSLLLNLLMKVIDPKSTGDMLQACKKLHSNSDLEEVLKVFAVAHNFEMEAISAILDNYQSMMKESEDTKKNQDTMLELRSQVATLTNKFHDMEKQSDMDSIRIRELEQQNAKLMDIANDRVDKLDQLKKLRFDDLTNKWKTAEVALSQTNKGAKMKIKELENELQHLRQQLRSERRCS